MTGDSKCKYTTDYCYYQLNQINWLIFYKLYINISIYIWHAFLFNFDFK